MAAIVATLDAMSEEGMVENARDIGAQVLGPGLKKLAERYPMIGEARGVGVTISNQPRTTGAVQADRRACLLGDAAQLTDRAPRTPGDRQ